MSSSADSPKQHQQHQQQHTHQQPQQPTHQQQPQQRPLKPLRESFRRSLRKRLSSSSSSSAASASAAAAEGPRGDPRYFSVCNYATLCHETDKTLHYEELTLKARQSTNLVHTLPVPGAYVLECSLLAVKGQVKSAPYKGPVRVHVELIAPDNTVMGEHQVELVKRKVVYTLQFNVFATHVNATLKVCLSSHALMRTRIIASRLILLRAPTGTPMSSSSGSMASQFVRPLLEATGNVFHSVDESDDAHEWSHVVVDEDGGDDNLSSLFSRNDSSALVVRPLLNDSLSDTSHLADVNDDDDDECSQHAQQVKYMQQQQRQHEGDETSSTMRSSGGSWRRSRKNVLESSVTAEDVSRLQHALVTRESFKISKRSKVSRLIHLRPGVYSVILFLQNFLPTMTRCADVEYKLFCVNPHDEGEEVIEQFKHLRLGAMKREFMWAKTHVSVTEDSSLELGILSHARSDIMSQQMHLVLLEERVDEPDLPVSREYIKRLLALDNSVAKQRRQADDGNAIASSPSSSSPPSYRKSSTDGQQRDLSSSWSPVWSLHQKIPKGDNVNIVEDLRPGKYVLYVAIAKAERDLYSSIGLRAELLPHAPGARALADRDTNVVVDGARLGAAGASGVSMPSIRLRFIVAAPCNIRITLTGHQRVGRVAMFAYLKRRPLSLWKRLTLDKTSTATGACVGLGCVALATYVVYVVAMLWSLCWWLLCHPLPLVPFVPLHVVCAVFTLQWAYKNEAYLVGKWEETFHPSVAFMQRIRSLRSAVTMREKFAVLKEMARDAKAKKRIKVNERNIADLVKEHQV